MIEYFFSLNEKYQRRFLYFEDRPLSGVSRLSAGSNNAWEQVRNFLPPLIFKGPIFCVISEERQLRGT